MTLRHTARTGLTVLFALLLVGCGSTADPDGDPADNDANGENQTANQNDDNGDPDEVDPPGETLKAGLSQDDAPDVDDDTFEQFSADNRDFAFDLVDQLRAEDEDDNVFISPHSISVAMAMPFAGAENNTRDEMADVMRYQLDDDQLHPAFNLLDLRLDERSEIELDDDEALDLNIVNQTWGQEDFHFDDDYLELLALRYGAGQQVVDFENDYEEIRQGINEWVAYQTEELIPQLLPENSLNDLTRFVLVNTIYFFGTWAEPFPEENTSDWDFTRLEGDTVEVEMMHEDRSYDAYYEEDADSVAVSIPYSGEEVSMIAVMPADEDADFQRWEDDFDRQAFDEVVDGFENQRLMLRFPKFEDEAGYEMAEVFEQMGMVDAFDECDADFEGITGVDPCIPYESLYIDDVHHNAVISVDEEGTEAAGATGVVMAGPTSAPPSVHFDRPFYYAIYDHPTDTILFMGRMVDPS